MYSTYSAFGVTKLAIATASPIIKPVANLAYDAVSTLKSYVYSDDLANRSTYKDICYNDYYAIFQPAVDVCMLDDYAATAA